MASGGRSAVDDLLRKARKDLDRVLPLDLAREVVHGAVLVDTRPVEQRERDGELPGALVIDRNVLEWRLDPTSPSRLPEATSRDTRYIVVCNQGYSSSLAAATLREIGLHRATDLVGGFQGLLAAGLVPRVDATPVGRGAPLNARGSGPSSAAGGPPAQRTSMPVTATTSSSRATAVVVASRAGPRQATGRAPRSR